MMRAQLVRGRRGSLRPAQATFHAPKITSHGLLIFRLFALPALAVSAIIVAINLTLSIMVFRCPFILHNS